MIRYIVGNCHVGQSYLSVVRYVLSRLAGKRRAFFKLTRRQRRKMLREVINAHRANRRVYEHVMRGF